MDRLIDQLAKWPDLFTSWQDCGYLARFCVYFWPGFGFCCQEFERILILNANNKNSLAAKTCQAELSGIFLEERTLTRHQACKSWAESASPRLDANKPRWMLTSYIHTWVSSKMVSNLLAEWVSCFVARPPASPCLAFNILTLELQQASEPAREPYLSMQIPKRWYNMYIIPLLLPKKERKPR